MTFHATNFRRPLAAVYALVALAALAPTGATAASSTVHEKPPLGISVPASAQVGGTTGPTTTAPASGAQPGTVAPGATPTSTTSTTSVPTTTTPPTATAPTATAPATTTPTTTAPAGTVLGTPTTVVGIARKPAPAKGLSTGALALAILGALLALGCAVWVVGRWLALEPRWTVSMMHSLREASFHASTTWAEFSDWARIGR